MTKPIVVENMEDSAGVVRVDTELWKLGPGADREASLPDPKPQPEIPKKRKYVIANKD